MPRVIVLQDNPFAPKDFSKAKKFGRLETVFSKHIRTDSIPALIPILKRTLEDISREDWLVAVGHPAVIGIATSMMAEATGYIKILVWEAKDAEYKTVEIACE